MTWLPPALLAVAVLGIIAHPSHAQPSAAQDATPVHYERLDWPRQMDTDSGKIILYQPQPIALSGIKLTARAAFSVAKGSAEPVFGVLWLTARAQTDRDNRMMQIDQIVLTDVRFADMTDSNQRRFRALVTPKVQAAHFSVPLDAVEVALGAAAAEQRTADKLATTPPAIVFSTVPAVLLLYHGKPIVHPIPKSSLKSVVNTPMLVALDPATSTYYLNGGPLWYSAADALGPWTSIASPPPAIGALVPDSAQRDSAPPGDRPKIIVATTPTELIDIRGEPEWTPIAGTDLAYVSNTDASVFKSVKDQKTYVLITGRWFRAPSFEGPWEFVRPDSLPAEFAKIPPDSPAGDVLTSVPGTEPANDAVLDAEIPQTAVVDRKSATLAVIYDGDPRFKRIEGTSIEYALNTASQVLRIGGLYYACDKAVWFVAPYPHGPWDVSDSVPQAVSTIPPTAPVYNVKFVEIYEVTPTTVYEGYTPGYTFSFPYYGTVVYGTGYVYSAYVSDTVYYPPPVTYGVMVRYNMWTGWTVGFGYSTPFMHVAVVVNPGYGGWYGPYGYPPYPPPFFFPPYFGYPGFYPIYGYPIYPSWGYPGYRPPGYGPGGIGGVGGVGGVGGIGGVGGPGGPPRPNNDLPGTGGQRPPSANNDLPGAAGQRPGRPNNDLPGAGGQRPTPKSNNIYRQPENANRVRPSTLPANTPNTRPAQTPNNVVGGQNGNVYRNQGGSWQTRQGNSWQGAGAGGAGGAGAAKPSTPTTRPNYQIPSQVNSDYQARQQGAQRAQQYNRSYGGGGGMGRGGGGRRR